MVIKRKWNVVEEANSLVIPGDGKPTLYPTEATTHVLWHSCSYQSHSCPRPPQMEDSDPSGLWAMGWNQHFIGKKISILLGKNKSSKPFPPMERAFLYSFIQHMFLYLRDSSGLEVMFCYQWFLCPVSVEISINLLARVFC